MEELVDGIPTRSLDGVGAIDIFYAEFNDVNFYVEDADQENLYLEILRKLFSNVRIERIFPLGGKPAVLNHAKSPDNDGIEAARIYIVDRDFDHLTGNGFVHPLVFYLDWYCIENHLLDPAALVEFAIECEPKRKRADIESKVKPDETVRMCYADAMPVFKLFFRTQLLELPMANTSLSPHSFCNGRKCWVILPEKVSEYEKIVIAKEAAVPVEQPSVDPDIASRLSMYDQCPCEVVVSGKFVAKMLFGYLGSKFKLGSLTFDSFIYRLAKNCSCHSLKPLAGRIQSVIVEHRSRRSSMLRNPTATA